MFGGGPKPFGAANPFGQQQQQTAFGKPTNAFGTSTFGQQQTAPLFGSTQPATGVFGASPAPVFGASAAPAFGTTTTTQPGFGSM